MVNIKCRICPRMRTNVTSLEAGDVDDCVGKCESYLACALDWPICSAPTLSHLALALFVP